MSNRRSIAGLFVLCIIFVQGCSAAKIPSVTPTVELSSTVEKTPLPSPVPENTASPVPTMTAVPVSLEGFSGKWISYNTISLEPGKEGKIKPGFHLEVAENHYTIGTNVCDNPAYEIKKISLEDFFKGKTPPTSSIELNEKEFPYLSTHCTNFEPAALANINSRTLAAVIGNDLLYFEPDFSTAENNMSIESDLLAESNKNPLYEIHAQIPVLKIPENEKFNNLVRTLVTTETDGFRKNFADWQIPAEMAGYTSFMWIGYDVTLLNPDLVSIRFAVDYYMAGAAHPNHYFKVINYDLKSNKEIMFDDVFIDQNKILPILSSFCKKALTKPDFPLFDEGFLPKRENFANWNLTKTGLRISFDPYQVAPYSSGPQEVLVPYNVIDKLIRPDSTVGAFIAR